MSNKFKKIFLLLTILLIFHAAEEYLTADYSQYPEFRDQAEILGTTAQMVFVYYETFYISCFIFIYFFLLNRRWFKPFLVVVGLIFFIQLEHPYHAYLYQSYYPGLFTSFLYFPLGFLYYQELLFGKEKSRR